MGLEDLVEDIWQAYEDAMSIDLSAGGCPHSRGPGGADECYVCHHCRKRMFLLVAVPRINEAMRRAVIAGAAVSNAIR